MTTETITPETLTFEHIKQWDGEAMKKHMANPEMREAIYNIVKTRSLAAAETTPAPEGFSEPQPTAESTATVETQSVTEQPKQDEQPKQGEQSKQGEQPKQDEQAQAEVQRAAAEQAEQARKAQEAQRKKIVIDYQVKDEDGNPIGRPTHLEAATQEELIEKMKEAHIQATRAFHRLKKQKVSFKEPAPAPAAPSISDAELLAAMKDLKSDDPQKQLDAVRKVNQAELEKQRIEYERKVAELNELRRQEQVSYAFLRRHQNDFNNCEANINLIKNYFIENELAWTLDNLEIAFHALESELAPVEVPVAPVVLDNSDSTSASTASVAPANPVQAPAQVSTSAAPSAVQPMATATAQVAAPVNPAPVTPRPGVNASIMPGLSSGSRPAVTQKGLTAEEIRSWDGPTMRAKMRNPAIRAQIEAFFAERNKNKK
jgi:hypothetical protein